MSLGLLPLCTGGKQLFLCCSDHKVVEAVKLFCLFGGREGFIFGSNTQKHKLLGQGFGRRQQACTFQDINDEVPRFRSPAYVAEIAENAQKNTPVTWLGKDNIAEVFIIIIIVIIIIING